MWSPGEEKRKTEAASAFMCLTVHQGRHPGSVTSIILNVVIEQTTGSEILAHEIMEDF